MTDWRSRWPVTVASDVSSRDGIGWEFADLQQRGVWTVFREDGGAFPVFSAARGDGALPPFAELEEMTRVAVDDLLAAADLRDDVGWNAKNISAALLLACCEVGSWEGVEWALESGDDDEALAWARPDDARVPLAWLRANGVDRDAVIGVYQDDANFGLCFIPYVDPTLPDAASGSLRPRQNIPLASGRMTAVEVVYNTVVEGGLSPGLLTEALLHGESGSTLLIAAEAYSRDEWHLYDESVVALTDPSAADSLGWVPPRRPWRPTA